MTASYYDGNDVRRTVLVVEDSEVNRMLLEGILRSDYDVLQAANGLEGLEILKANLSVISLILLDLSMPVMSGYEFMEIVEQDSELRRIPIIVITANSSSEEEERCLALGAHDFIGKPYHPRATLARMKNIIRMVESANALNELEFDDLTGLYTKQAFLRHATERVASNPDKQFGILALDIENFRLTNSLYGEQKCDEYLAFLGKLINDMITTSIAGRYGGDQFAILFEVKDTKDPFPTKLIYDEALLPAPIPHQIIKKGVCAPIDKNLPIMRNCDNAFLANRMIKGIYDKNLAFYDDKLDQKLINEQRILDCMEDALYNDQFTVYYQPKHDSISKRVVGAEALVRWHHPQFGFMSPGEFIPLFEKNGFIVKLDAFVVERVCQDINRWQMDGVPIAPVSINVSRKDYLEPGWFDRMINVIDSYGIDHSYIHVEVTESLYANNAEIIIEQVKKAQDLGFLIEMDDFGAGYSSLGMLATFPLDIIKLDISFVNRLDINRIVIENIINLAHRMGFRTTAEGVENAGQLAVLQELGCDYIQGYLFSSPMPVDRYEDYVQRYLSEIPNAGARFRMESTEYISPLNSIPDNEKRTVLIIDDNEINRDSLSRILAGHYKVLQARDGKEGLGVLINNYKDISAILLDLQMPVMNGYEFMEMIRRDHVFTEIPIIITTIKDSAQEEDRCLRMGAVEFVAKPYNPALIIARLGHIIEYRESMKRISELEIDPLTGFKNRKVYYSDIKDINKKKNKKLGIMFLDINSLKYTNDNFGHEAGDRLIGDVAKIVRTVFSDAEIYRLGGDEFVALSFDDNEDAFNKRIVRLRGCLNGSTSAAIGSVWVDEITDIEQHIALADKLMYKDKSKFYELKMQDRLSVVGASSEEILNKAAEISDYMPGGFFIYHADDKQELISFNEHLVKLYDCENREEFIELVDNSFRGMVHPDDFSKVSGDISSQIQNDRDVDYVEYRIITKTGRVKNIRDYGRFVHTSHIGDVYFVFVYEIVADET